jgi:hypothetical protein
MDRPANNGANVALFGGQYASRRASDSRDRMTLTDYPVCAVSSESHLAPKGGDVK